MEKIRPLRAGRVTAQVEDLAESGKSGEDNPNEFRHACAGVFVLMTAPKRKRIAAALSRGVVPLALAVVIAKVLGVVSDMSHTAVLVWVYLPALVLAVGLVTVPLWQSSHHGIK
ncbi:MAG: hypothetical protein LBJ02_04490, partial [Bifidobacteriaceae bacterium]|nr:hypothetical protein [Bifidobacteriaceae bacterium]